MLENKSVFHEIHKGHLSDCIAKKRNFSQAEGDALLNWTFTF